MEHPSLCTSKIREDLSIEEIQKKITDLNSRLSFATQTGSIELSYQIQLALNTYNRAYQEKIDEQFGNNKDDPTDQIDIS